MNRRHFGFVVILLIVNLSCNANQKVYLIHGYGGLGIEMEKIHKAIEKKGFISEIFTYLSLADDVDSVGKKLFKKIREEGFDTVNFVTHSMGALVVRSMYNQIDSLTKFPFIYRIVMIAPPNNGSPVADFFVQFSFIKFIVGPNINNLTTNPISGAGKYPIPTCEVGLIAGSYSGKKGVNVFINDDNDGVLIPQNTKMGVEKDMVFVKSWHVGLLFNTKVIRLLISFLETGKFKDS
jgi:uncharacterized alpha/beta hydrolase family protein